MKNETKVWITCLLSDAKGIKKKTQIEFQIAS